MPPEHENYEREQRMADLIQQVSASTHAPDSLRLRIDALREQPSVRAPRGQRLRAGGLRLRAGLAGATASVAAVVAVVLVIAGGTAAPSLAAVTALAGRGPAGPAPGVDASAPKALLSTAVGGLHFPNWQSQGGWRSTGQRTDTVSGRRVKTVYYTHDGTRLAYSIVAQPALAGSSGVNEPYKVVSHGRQVSVIWTVKGHTCVLSGVGVSQGTLWNLASTTLG
jgi:hypothetical protein